MRLLNSRSACAVEIGRMKRRLGLPVYSPEREAWILERVMRENPGPLDPTAVRRVFERIIDESRRLERLAADGRRKRDPENEERRMRPMVIVMEQTATEEQIQKVIEALVEVGYDVHRSTGVSHTVLGAVGVAARASTRSALELIPGVREVVKISEPYKLVGRTFKAADTVVDVAGVRWAGRR